MDIKDAALKYLTSRSRTCGEMNKHLEKQGFHPDAIREIIEHLKELHYLDDFDYSCRYLEYAFGKGRGFLRARRELEEKGVDRETIQLAFEEYESGETELERAEKQAAKIAEGRVMDQKLPGKIGRRLNSMGYSADVIYQVVGKYMRQS